MPNVRVVRLALLLAAAVLPLVGAPVARADPVSLGSLRPVGTPLRVVLLPIRLRGQHAPTAARLQRLIRQTSALVSGASFGRIIVSGVVAPPIAAGRYETSPRFLDSRIFDHGVGRAAARGVRFDGAVPVFVAASRTPTASYGSPDRVLLQGSTWDVPSAFAHELGHVLGLDHAIAPSACRRPFRPLACAARPRQTYGYGDDFDIMGEGGDRYGAYSQAILRLAAITDAPHGRARISLRPSDRPAGTLLRLRTGPADYLVESRVRAALRYQGAFRAPAGVEISRVSPVYTASTNGESHPSPLRLPATDPGVACSGDRACAARQVFGAGRSLTVPGAFRLRVLRGRGAGRARVETTWLDRTPPSLAVSAATVVPPAGAATAELELDVRADATGAGLLTVEVDQGSAPVEVAVDDVAGLASGGRGIVHVPLLAGATAARVTAIDAAGNRSASALVDVAAAAIRPAASIAFDPRPGADGATAVPLAAGRAITVSGATDPDLAGLEGSLSILSSSVSNKVPIVIGSDGAFSATWAPRRPGLYQVEVTVPVGRRPGGDDLVRQTTSGWFRR